MEQPGIASLGIRPEDIGLADGATDDNHFRARVRVAVELVGAESYVHGSLAGGALLVFRVAGRSRIGIDDEVKVFARPESLHGFDTAGRRLQKHKMPRQTPMAQSALTACEVVTECHSLHRGVEPLFPAAAVHFLAHERIHGRL